MDTKKFLSAPLAPDFLKATREAGRYQDALQDALANASVFQAAIPKDVFPPSLKETLAGIGPNIPKDIFGSSLLDAQRSARIFHQSFAAFERPAFTRLMDEIASATQRHQKVLESLALPSPTATALFAAWADRHSHFDAAMRHAFANAPVADFMTQARSVSTMLDALSRTPPGFSALANIDTGWLDEAGRLADAFVKHRPDGAMTSGSETLREVLSDLAKTGSTDAGLDLPSLDDDSGSLSAAWYAAFTHWYQTLPPHKRFAAYHFLATLQHILIGLLVGYLTLQWLTRDAESVTPEVNQVVNLYGVGAVEHLRCVRAGRLNVREQPNPAAAVIDIVTRHQTVETGDYENGFYRIRYMDDAGAVREGWAAAGHLVRAAC